MAKLKFDLDKNCYKLRLSEDEMHVIAKLIAHTRIGNPDNRHDKYTNASLGICTAIGEYDEQLFGEASSVALEVWATTDGLTPAAIIHEENVVIIVKE